MNIPPIIKKICEELTVHEGYWHHAQFGSVAYISNLETLTQFLYKTYYLGNIKSDTDSPPTASQIRDHEDPIYTNTIISCIPYETYFSNGWNFFSKSKNGITVEKQGLKLLVRDADIHENSEGNYILKMPAVRRYASLGYLTAYGEFGPANPQQGIDRLYINTTAKSADAVLSKTLEWASNAQTPITIKTANSSSGYLRYDSTVAYLPRTKFRQVRNHLIEILQDQTIKILNATPAFTASLAPGIAWAEDPNSDGLGQLSFGMHRCRMTAGALCKLNQDTILQPQEWGAVIKREWAAQGFDLNTPHLSPKATGAHLKGSSQ